MAEAARIIASATGCSRLRAEAAERALRSAGLLSLKKEEQQTTVKKTINEVISSTENPE